MHSEKLTHGTKSSIRITGCQTCGSPDLKEIISLGHIPQVNVMRPIGSDLQEEVFFPAEMLLCNKCSLVQLSHIVDPQIVFPPEYTYRSRTTKILRENFAELASEVQKIIGLNKDDLVVDIGSNDGELLSNFKEKCQVLGIEPTNAAQYANAHGIPTMQRFFNQAAVDEMLSTVGAATIITAANVFAHIEDVHSIVEAITRGLDDKGVFISESHYLVGLLKTVQYDTIYHEHLRYYSLTSLKYLFEMHGMEVFHAKKIPTHGGSIRVYAARKGERAIMPSIADILEEERLALTDEAFKLFRQRVVSSKDRLWTMLSIKQATGEIGAIGAPSRASTLVSYVGLTEDNLKFVLEASGSQKIGKYMPGTKIPILEETPELLSSVDTLLMLSWHIADELIPKIRAKGFKGRFLLPLGTARYAE